MKSCIVTHQSGSREETNNITKTDPCRNKNRSMATKEKKQNLRANTWIHEVQNTPKGDIYQTA